ncbi:MAG: hypothetical protein HYX96_04835 [Chloroflexi bacterium]|nr:hypothetical protein [Chloroflexota bacterium]
MVNYPVLVLNQNYEPLTVCRARRAIVLVYQGKAEMLENGVGFIRSARETLPLPSVIRLEFLIKRPRRKKKMTRYEIFNRVTTLARHYGVDRRRQLEALAGGLVDLPDASVPPR